MLNRHVAQLLSQAHPMELRLLAVPVGQVVKQPPEKLKVPVAHLVQSKIVEPLHRLQAEGHS